MNDFNPQYKTIKCSKLSIEDISKCSELFSMHYGKYSGKDNHNKNERIRLKPSFYEQLKKDENMYVSLCYNNEELLGHAFFLRKQIKDKGYCSWVTQLVVHSSYRNRKIGSRLLQSAWGFSNDYAWGVATSNPVTIKTLESVTYRDVNISNMKVNMDVIEVLSKDIKFAKLASKDYIIFNDKKSQFYTRFYPDIEYSKKREIHSEYEERFGEIMDGHEWLAFTFKEQPFVSLNDEKLERLLDFSTQQLQEAYGRMNMPEQAWTQGTSKEVEYIIEELRLKQGKILDFGCGMGRHCIEFSKRGFDITGVDFSEALIKKANIQNKNNITFIHGDCRKFLFKEKFDLILCLYDVIGSFRDEKENIKIINNIYANLKKGGKAVISVMNMELTKHLAMYQASLRKNPEELLKLKASTIMKESGDVFNPEYYLIDTDSNLVFRREQFNQDELLATEYILADKRYTRDEISQLFINSGFKINLATFVQAGKWNISLEPTNNKAKEILLIVEKPE